MGPIINEEKQKSKIMNLIEQSIAQGAKVTLGGKARDVIIEQTVRRNI
jgi:acyl-CoA reductase-like NAD-dependent aldehyde dehydrogenase